MTVTIFRWLEVLPEKMNGTHNTMHYTRDSVYSPIKRYKGGRNYDRRYAIEGGMSDMHLKNVHKSTLGLPFWKKKVFGYLLFF